MEKLYTAQEIADRLKIKKNTVYELIKRGEIKSSKIGKQIRISQQDLDNYLNIPSNNSSNELSSSPNPYAFSTFATESSVLKRDYIKYSSGLIISGHEPLLDYLCSQINIHPNGLPTLRSQIGSYDSLYSLYFKKIHIAAIHLWDRESNTYNIPYIKHFLPGKEIAIIHFLKRNLGFYVYKNNPKKITHFKDLVKSEIKMINREPGSGTRILIDAHLLNHHLDSSKINGYENEVLSDFAAASSVSTLKADVAIGCESILSQFPLLDFVPVQSESFDLVMLKEDFYKPSIQTLKEILNNPDFKESIAQIKGYDITEMGNYEFIE